MQLKGFRPCYKWNAFNTHEDCRNNPGLYGFKPCYKWNAFNTQYNFRMFSWSCKRSFKPCYKWNAFNTLDFARVLNSWLFSSFFNPRNIWPKSRNLSTFLFFVLNIYYFFWKKLKKLLISLLIQIEK